jgi:hypothetical protein
VLWRRNFDAVERLLRGQLEELVLTRTFNDLLALTWRTQRSARRLLDGQTSAVLHFWNMPTRTDVSKLRRQLGVMAADLEELAAELERDLHPHTTRHRDGVGPICSDERRQERSQA